MQSHLCLTALTNSLNREHSAHTLKGRKLENRLGQMATLSLAGIAATWNNDVMWEKIVLPLRKDLCVTVNDKWFLNVFKNQIQALFKHLTAMGNYILTYCIQYTDCFTSSSH